MNYPNVREGPRGLILPIPRNFRAFDCASVCRRALGLAFFAVALLSFVAGCKKEPPPSKETPVAAPRGALELVFPYGSEKEKWIGDVTTAFNRSGAKTQSGKTIFVRALPTGSGESIDNILSGRLQAHLVSPASAAFIKLGNADARSKTG